MNLPHIPTQAMIVAGELAADLILEAKIAVEMNGLGGGKSVSDLSNKYCYSTQSSVSLIYQAMVKVFNEENP